MPSQSFLVYIEDDPLSREVFEHIVVNRLGLGVNVFDGNHDLMDNINTLPHPPSVFFVDIQMSPLNGYDIIAMLRENPNYADASVIAVTASVMASDVEKLRNAGFNGLIGKPISKQVFPRLIEKILNNEDVWYIP